ncbi:uncharacterized protein LOC141847304 [Curcuma longa]|uniref:uncharacterized protein LOC141847304 n=1 Tax=Curcuma longa TaxID=136217 RepID=UPI003D9FA3C0
MMFSGGGGDAESLSERMAMLVEIPIQMSLAPGEEMAVASGGGGGGASLPRRRKEERFPQWGQQETGDLIAIRADLERDPSAARRNRTLWEAVAARMRDLGYHRTPDQCKSKLKSLVNRYKGEETVDPGAAGRQWPFSDELSVVFKQRRRLESESGSSQRKKKPKRLSIQELLQEFLQQQQQMELQRCETMRRRAQERQVFELERRQSMEKLEREKLMLEQSWREEKEQRRKMEESRAENRDALLTTLLNKFIQDL